MEKPENRFCRKCGTEMIASLRGAEKYLDHKIWKITPFSPAGEAFDKDTGERNMRWSYKCPKGKWWKEVFMSIDHDDFAVGELIKIKQ